MAVAESRAVAEDALELVDISWGALASCANLAEAVSPGAARVHPELATNVAFESNTDSGDVDGLFATAACVVEDVFVFGRHTGLPLETRGIIASFDVGENRLSVWQSTQVPNQAKVYFAELLDIPAHRVQVIAPDVGGAFGMKMHVYPDEIAVAAASKHLGLPIKFICDRLESFASDAHAREHVIGAKAAFDESGRLLAFDIDDLFGMGAYSMFPRTGVMEPLGAMRLIGAPYDFQGYRARMRACFLNKSPSAQCRAVGHPIAVAVTECLVEKAGRRLGIDVLEMRRRNYLEPGHERVVTPAGATVYDMSHTACLDKIVGLMDLPRLQRERGGSTEHGLLRGIGFAAYVEMTATGPAQYGQMGVRISSSDTVSVTLEPSGGISCSTSTTDQGQGTTAAIMQILADAIGVETDQVTVRSGDSAAGMGGGAWASRGTAIGGEAAWKGARRLKQNILATAAALLQGAASGLDVRAGTIVDSASGAVRMTLADLADVAYFRAGELPPGLVPQLAVSEQYYRGQDPSLPTNGIQAAYVEVDTGTGEIELLGHWVVDDCGVVVNPLLLDEQIRGGIVQGLGAALYENLPYNGDGQLMAGTLADYKLPLASGMPDIVVGHVSTPYSGSELGIKGGGEAGTCAAAAAVLNAVNDALSRLGVSVSELPLTPQVILSRIAAPVTV